MITGMSKNSSKSQIIKSLFAFMVLGMTFFSCSFVRSGCGYFTKDAETDSADDIYDVILSETPEGEYITAIEVVFQGKRKTKQGIRGGYDGYWEKRISCYDVSSGELLGRYVCGKREVADCFLLGKDSLRIWFFSIDKELGLHARELPSLEVTVTQKEILETNPGFEFIEAPESELSQHFRFEKNVKCPVIKNKSGEEFLLNPNSLKAETPRQEIELYNTNPNNTTNSLVLAANRYIKISPEGTVSLDMKQTQLEDVINGEFLESTIIATFPKKQGELFSEDVSGIITEDSSAFILSQDEEGDNSKCVISKVIMNQDSTVELDWQIELHEYYRYPEKALADGFFDSLFGKGNPDFNTMMVLHTNDKLIFIYNLRMLCMDIETGDTVWEIEL
jgi:hypothetical protein